MKWKKILEILFYGPKDSMPKFSYPNFGRGRSFGIDINHHLEIFSIGAAEYQLDTWTQHYYCPNCGLHSKYGHNLVIKAKKTSNCVQCGNSINTSFLDLPIVTVCLRKSAFPDGTVFYFWEFKNETEKQIILTLHEKWRISQKTRFYPIKNTTVF